MYFFKYYKDMEALTKNYFDERMDGITDRLNKQEELILLGKKESFSEQDKEQLLDNQDLCNLLKVSKRTLQRYRSCGMLSYQLLRHKIYYRVSDVHRFIKTHVKNFNGEIPD